jgi:hypothetical protein
LDIATVEALHGAFQDAQRFRLARRALRRTTPSATMAAVEISGAGAAMTADAAALQSSLLHGANGGTRGSGLL